MTQKERQLLLIDLCARLPYDVKVATSQYQYGDISIPTWIVGDRCYFVDNPRNDDGDCPIEDIKPYLRPIHKLTKEELEELEFLTDSDYVDYCNEHHIDYRNLIPKGLALEAKEGMYNW